MYVQVDMERVAIEAEIGKWRELSEKNTSLKEMIDESRILDYLKDIKKVVDDN